VIEDQSSIPHGLFVRVERALTLCVFEPLASERRLGRLRRTPEGVTYVPGLFCYPLFPVRKAEFASVRLLHVPSDYGNRGVP